VGFQAINAVGGEVAKKHTCVIAKEDDLPIPIGSGTFAQVDNQLFVATAKHLFDDFRTDEFVAIYWGEQDNRAEVIRRDIIFHEELDLAAIPLPADTQACGASSRCLQPDHLEAEPDLFLVSGIPTEKCKLDPTSRTVAVGHCALGLVSLPLESWPTDPGLAISPDADLFFNYTKDLAINANGQRMRQIDPHGLSGGGIWSVPVVADGIWSPTDARLVAVQRSVESYEWRYLRANRIECWLRLVKST